MGLKTIARRFSVWQRSIDYSYAGSSTKSCARCGTWIACDELVAGVPREARTE